MFFKVCMLLIFAFSCIGHTTAMYIKRVRSAILENPISGIGANYLRRIDGTRINNAFVQCHPLSSKENCGINRCNVQHNNGLEFSFCGAEP